MGLVLCRRSDVRSLRPRDAAQRSDPTLLLKLSVFIGCQFGCLLGSGPATSVRSIRLGFLGPWPFRCEDPARRGWISLDFLGFSRPNRDFSMGYADFSGDNLSRAFPWR